MDMNKNNLGLKIFTALMAIFLIAAVFSVEGVPGSTGGVLSDSTVEKEPTTAIILTDTIRSAVSPADSISTASGYANYKYVKWHVKNLNASAGDTVKFYYVSATGDTSIAGFWGNGNTTGVPDTMLVLAASEKASGWMDTPYPFRVLAIKTSLLAGSGKKLKFGWELIPKN